MPQHITHHPSEPAAPTTALRKATGRGSVKRAQPTHEALGLGSMGFPGNLLSCGLITLPIILPSYRQPWEPACRGRGAGAQRAGGPQPSPALPQAEPGPPSSSTAAPRFAESLGFTQNFSTQELNSSCHVHSFLYALLLLFFLSFKKLFWKGKPIMQ